MQLSRTESSVRFLLSLVCFVGSAVSLMDTGPSLQLVCGALPFIWRTGTATVTAGHPPREGKSNQILRKVKILCWLECSPGAFALRLRRHPQTALRGDKQGNAGSWCSLGLGLLGLGDFLACSPEIAFHLHKLGGIFLLFLQFLLLKFKLLQPLLSFQQLYFQV